MPESSAKLDVAMLLGSHRGPPFRANLRLAMFVIELLYRVPLSEIDAAMPAHMTFLRRNYAAGRFLVSGRKVPRDGGIILALGESREAVEALVQEDPFVAQGLADFRVIEFRESQRAESIDALLDGGR